MNKKSELDKSQTMFDNLSCPHILLRFYTSEYMMYLDGKRHFEAAMASREQWQVYEF